MDEDTLPVRLEIGRHSSAELSGIASLRWCFVEDHIGKECG